MRLRAVAGPATDQGHLSDDVIHGTRRVLTYGLFCMPLLYTGRGCGVTSSRPVAQIEK
jgi:hypothetical protein